MGNELTVEGVIIVGGDAILHNLLLLRQTAMVARLKKGKKIPEAKASGIMVRLTGLEPVRSPTRPSNVRVCLFRHNRANIYIILASGWLVKPLREIISVVSPCRRCG